MRNVLFILLIVIVIGLLITGKVGYDDFKSVEKKLQGRIDSNNAVVLSLELRNKTLLDSNVLSNKRELKLLGELKTSQDNKENIKKYYEAKFNYIHTASDDEYIEYLRARISDIN